jgi:DNA-binding NtrC family response regulator
LGRTDEVNGTTRRQEEEALSRPAALECVLLVRHPERSAALQLNLERAGIRYHVAETAGFSRLLLALTRSHVLLAEPAPGDAHWMAELCMLAQRGDEARWVAWLPEFDSERWMEMVDRGAYDVICPPYSPESLRRIVASAEQHALGPRAGPRRLGHHPVGWWVLRFRNLLLLRSR